MENETTYINPPAILSANDLAKYLHISRAGAQESLINGGKSVCAEIFATRKSKKLANTLCIGNF